MSVDDRGGVYMHVDFEGHYTLDFDKKKVKRAMASIGRDVRAEARRLVARAAVSRPGENPGRDTGLLRQSIGFKVSRPGFLVVIKPKSSAKMPDFYPAYLNYGVRRANAGSEKSYANNRRRKQGHTKGSRRISSWRIAPRGNYMIEALKNRQGFIQRELFAALKQSLEVT